MPELLTIRHLHLRLGGKQLLRGLDLSIGRGHVAGVSGESGCGKTSLLRAVLGFVPTQSGSISICGTELTPQTAPRLRRLTAYVPQELMPVAATGRDMVQLTHTLEANLQQASHEALDRQMEALGLEPSLLDLDTAKLSGGQRQRLLLAAALAMGKPLLLLDEPTSALDAESRERVAAAIASYCRQEERAAIIVSHDQALLQHCHSVVNLR